MEWQVATQFKHMQLPKRAACKLSALSQTSQSRLLILGGPAVGPLGLDNPGLRHAVTSTGTQNLAQVWLYPESGSTQNL